MSIKKTLLFAGLYLLFLQLIVAQSKELSLEAAILEQRTSLAPANIDQLMWVADEDAYSFIEKEGGDEVVKQQRVGEATSKVTLRLSKLNEVLVAVGKDKRTTFPHLKWLSENELLFSGKDGYHIYSVNKQQLVSLNASNDGVTGFDLEPTSYHLAYTEGNNLKVKPFGMDEVAITNDKNEDIVNGQAVHRFEFGISKGTFWSPKGNLLAFYRNDQSAVSNYPLVEIHSTPAKLKNIKYPMAGMPSEKVSLGIYDLKTKRTIFLETSPDFEYLTNISWDPSEQFIYVAALNRDQNHMRLDKYVVTTGKWAATLFEEKNEKYVEPLHPIYFLNSEKEGFLWISKRDGFMHVYHYAYNGQLVKQLTKGNWVVQNVLGFNADRSVMFVEGTGADATTTHLYRIDINTGKVKQLTETTGTHQGQLSSSGNFILDEYSAVDVPRVIELIDREGKKQSTLLKADNPMKDYRWRAAELFTLQGGVPLQCRMIKPSDFDEKKKYPVLVYVYNGPHVQLIRNKWMAGAPLWMYYMAERGYLIFTIDGRGSANRGVDFEQAVFRQLGTLEMEDQMKGVAHLKTLSYVDNDRMALHGWSFGGFMTTSIMLNYPEIFKVGVAGGPVIDWKFYEVMYTERYMDSPEQNPEGYAKASLLNKVDQLQGKLLMIHGLMDDVVVPQHNLSFVRSCVEKGVQIDFFPYPTHPHNVRGRDRVHLMQKVIDYIDLHLNTN
jgi:dipeptidyl-peptidase-4